MLLHKDYLPACYEASIPGRMRISVWLSFIGFCFLFVHCKLFTIFHMRKGIEIKLEVSENVRANKRAG